MALFCASGYMVVVDLQELTTELWWNAHTHERTCAHTYTHAR